MLASFLGWRDKCLPPFAIVANLETMCVLRKVAKSKVMRFPSWRLAIRDAGTGAVPPCPLKVGATGAQVPLHFSRDAGKQWNDGAIGPCLYKMGAEVPFHNRIIDNFMVYQDRFETNLLQLKRTYEIQNGFLYLLLFLSSTLLLRNNKHNWQIFLFFTSFHCPQHFYCPPCPTGVPASLLAIFCKPYLCEVEEKQKFDI